MTSPLREDPAAAPVDPSDTRSTAWGFTRALQAADLLRSAAAEMFVHSALHVQLLQLEWAQEKQRLTQMLVASVIGFACLLCVMLMIAVLVMAHSWDTVYRLHAAVGLLVFYSLAAELARRRLRALVAAGSVSFAASRAEWAADIALLRSKL